MAKSKKPSAFSASTNKASTPKPLMKTLASPKELDLSTTSTVILECGMIGLTCIELERSLAHGWAAKQILTFGSTTWGSESIREISVVKKNDGNTDK